MKHRRGLIVFEISTVENFGERRLEMIVSIPGHEGVGQIFWPMTPNSIAPDTWFDVNMKMMELLSAAVNTAGGAQEVLPL